MTRKTTISRLSVFSYKEERENGVGRKELETKDPNLFFIITNTIPEVNVRCYDCSFSNCKICQISLSTNYTCSLHILNFANVK